MFTTNHSFFFLLTLLIHIAGILAIANLLDRHDETSMAVLDIGAVELNLSELMEESLPSPPPFPPPPEPEPEPPPEPEPMKPEPEKVPDKLPEAELQPPEITHPEPKFKTISIPTPESVVLPKPELEPATMTPPEPEPPRIEAPRPEPPPLPEPQKPTKPAEKPAVKHSTKPAEKPAVTQPPIPKTPPSQTPESGAAAAMIDQPPKPRRSIKPRYPTGARRRGEEGSVTLDVAINASGRAYSVNIARSSGFAELDAAAKQAVRTARFTPGQNKGKNVESQARLTIIFKLK